jgi:hypothetical protein
VQSRIQFFSLGQILDLAAESFITALNKQDVKPPARDLQGDNDARGACAYYSEIRRERGIAA